MTHPFATSVPSPLGPLEAVFDGDELVGLRFAGDRPAGRRVRSAAASRVATAVDEFFAGRRTAFDDVAIRLDGTAFQVGVWDVVRTIPYGATTTYSDVARRLGLGASFARAVGAANARNPISIVVPCHRLVTSSGTLAGYAGGTWRKRSLLDLEAGRRSTA